MLQLYHSYTYCLLNLHLFLTSLSLPPDLTDNYTVLGQRRDHCDILLDAIDAQLGQLQVCVFHSLCQTSHSLTW